jgi:DNA primase large subunit
MKNSDAFKRFLESVSITFNKIDNEEKENLRTKLMSCPIGDTSSPATSLADFTKAAFYKIPFLHALDLVKSRLVYIERGYAYVPTPR